MGVGYLHVLKLSILSNSLNLIGSNCRISQKYLIDAMRRMLTKDVLGDQVKHEKDENTEQVYQRGFLRSLLMNPDLSVEDILVTASDFMMAGVDTVSKNKLLKFIVTLAYFLFWTMQTIKSHSYFFFNW